MKNEHFNHYVTPADYRTVLVDEEAEYVEVTMRKWECNGYHDKWVIYRAKLTDHNYGKDYCGLGICEFFIGEYFDLKTALKAFANASKGLVCCNYCGDWIPIEESQHYIPATVTCNKPECKHKASAEEEDFFRYPLD